MTQRLIAFALYVTLLVTVLWAGGGALGYAADYHFYSSFLAPWQRALQRYRAEGRPWPAFNNNHVEYMTELTRRVTAHTGFRPPGAGRGAFTYRLTKPGTDHQHVLILGQPARLVVYGLTTATARRLDRFADGSADLGSGAFRGQPGTRPDTTIVTWSY